ncbi:MAG: MlaD family protein [Acidobacteriota bacterium]
MSRSSEIRTGFFVVIGVVIFVVLSLWIAGVNPWGPEKTQHRVLMRDAGGVRAGDSVRVAGVRVGRVLSVDLQTDPEWPVAFQIELDAGAPVGQDSQAFFGSDGLLGARFLALEPLRGGTTPIASGDELRGGRASASIDDMLGQADLVIERAVTLLDETTMLVRTVGERVDPLLDRIEMLASEENAEELRATLSTLRATLDEAGPRLPALLDRLDRTLASVESGTEAVPEITAEARALLTDLRAAIGPDGRRLSDLLDSADGTLDSASGALGAVTGSVGDLEATMRDLRATADNLEALTRSLGEQPNRLIFPSRKADRRPGEGTQQ